MLVGVQSKHLQIFLWVSSEIFGKPWSSWEMFEDICVAFRQFVDNLWKSLESGRKSSENCQKQHYQYVYTIYYKQNIMWFLVDMEDVFSCSIVYTGI